MIARKYRFHGYNALSFVYKKGSTVRTPSCMLRYVRNDHRKYCRIAVVVSKKTQKSAVERNRIRRKIYVAVERAGVGSLPPYDLVFTVIDGRIANETEKNIQQTIYRLLQTVHIPHEAVDK